MFTLAHLSDPHLAPLPKPRWSELIGKRVTGYLNWQRRRRFIHDAKVLGKIVADLKAQAARPHRGHRRLANIALQEEFERGRKWLQEPGLAARRQLRPRQSRCLCVAKLSATRRYGRPI